MSVKKEREGELLPAACELNWGNGNWRVKRKRMAKAREVEGGRKSGGRDRNISQ